MVAVLDAFCRGPVRWPGRTSRLLLPCTGSAHSGFMTNTTPPTIELPTNPREDSYCPEFYRVLVGSSPCRKRLPGLSAFILRKGSLTALLANNSHNTLQLSQHSTNLSHKTLTFPSTTTIQSVTIQESHRNPCLSNIPSLIQEYNYNFPSGKINNKHPVSIVTELDTIFNIRLSSTVCPSIKCVSTFYIAFMNHVQ